jgi:8-oxo-dGTP pyrophosphatase MutT (NUDIX family)
MNAYIAAVHHRHRGPVEVLLGQRNIYLPPHGRFQFAAISRNAVQYVLPGGKVEPGDSLERTALREFHEATGVELHGRRADAVLQRLQRAIAFFRVDYEHAHGHHGVELINLAIAEGRTRVPGVQPLRVVRRSRAAQCALGNKPEYQQLPWVAPGSSCARSTPASAASTSTCAPTINSRALRAARWPSSSSTC